MCTVMDSFLKGVFVRADKHTSVHGVHPHTGHFIAEMNLERPLSFLNNIYMLN